MEEKLSTNYNKSCECVGVAFYVLKAFVDN